MEILAEKPLVAAQDDGLPLDASESETRPAACKEPIARAGEFIFYKDPNGFVRAYSEDEDWFVCSAAIEPLEKLVNPETGSVWLRVSVTSKRSSREIRFPVSKGAAGLVRALQEMGEFVRPKLATAYVEAVLVDAWASLEERDITSEEGAEASQVTALLYELFLEFVRDFAPKFDSEEWGWIEEGKDGENGKVVVTRPVMAEFFRRAGVSPDIQTTVLKNWRDRKWLLPGKDKDKRHLTRTARVGGVVRRCYVVVLPPEGAATHDWTKGAEVEEKRKDEKS